MIIISPYDAAGAVKPPAGALWALGCFDGIHVGHAALLFRAAHEAKAMGAPFGVWSPDGAKNAPLVMDKESKLRALEELGADFCMEDSFEAIRDLSPREFVFDYLMGRYSARALVCGENFTFGRGRAGNVKVLEALCHEGGLPLFVLPTVNAGGAPVSSARVRAALLSGDVKSAGELLGRPFGFFSVVTKGRRVGGKLGFPTLNLPIPEGMAIPKNGVYTALVSFHNGKRLPAVANIGVHPTFSVAERPLCEAHLLETDECFSGGRRLDGQKVYIRFFSFIREERRFSLPAELSRQIEEDAAEARSYFADDPELKKQQMRWFPQ